MAKRVLIVYEEGSLGNSISLFCFFRKKEFGSFLWSSDDGINSILKKLEEDCKISHLVMLYDNCFIDALKISKNFPRIKFITTFDYALGNDGLEESFFIIDSGDNFLTEVIAYVKNDNGELVGL